MTNDEIRAVLAPMYKGQSTVLKTPDLIIEVNFDVKFHICHKTRMGSSAGVYATASLKDAVEYISHFFLPKQGQVYQHNNGNIYTIITIANENSLRPEYPPSVVYKGENGLTWCKPLVNFLRKMKRIK